METQTVKPYIYQSYTHRVKPPVLSFTLLLVGMVLVLVGGLLFMFNDYIEFAPLSYALFWFGVVLATANIAYMVGRGIKIRSEQDTDLNGLDSWLMNTYNLYLNKEELEMLSEYSLVEKDGFRYIMHYTVTNEGLVGYLLTDATVRNFPKTRTINIDEETDSIREKVSQVKEHKLHTQTITVIKDETVEEIKEKIITEPIDLVDEENNIGEKIVVDEGESTIGELVILEELEIDTTIEKDELGVHMVTDEEDNYIETDPEDDEDYEEEENPTDSVESLQKLKLTELKNLAKTLEIKGYYSMNKSALVKIIFEKITTKDNI